MENLSIQELHMQNNAYRDLIKDLKEQINTYDKKIAINEILIGKELTDMDELYHYDCTLCLGDCQ